MIYKPISIDVENYKLLDDCKLLYLDNYPQMKKIPISRNKILYEIIKFYLKNTKYEVGLK